MFIPLLAAVSMISPASHVGPIPLPKGAVKVAPGRVEGLATTPKSSPIRGTGKWIWLEGKHDAARFFKKIECPKLPKKALIKVTADTSYRLMINGQIVARGPADIGRDYDIGPTGPWFYDVVDVAKWLRKGENDIAVEVIFRPLVQSEGTLEKPGLWLEADLETQHIGTDETWLAGPNKDLGFAEAAPGEPLHQKGTFLTLSGSVPGDNWLQGLGQEWHPAQLVPSAARPLIQSEIPAPMEVVYPSIGETRVRGAVTIHDGMATFTGDGGYGVRYDRVLSAHIVLRVEGGKGSVLTLMPNERNEEGFHRAVRLKLTGGVQLFEVPFYDSFSVINIEASGVTEPLTIHQVQAVFRSYPVSYRGSFECSDTALTENWEVGRWSTQICMQTHHLDSPHHQEPISDPGDYLIESLISYNTFGEAGLAKQDLRKYGQIIRNRQGRVFHTSYALLWLQMLVQYFDHTGDKDLLVELAPTVSMLIDTWESWRGENGLISQPPNFMFIDWVEIEGFNLHHPPAVIGQGTLTAFYYRALEDASRIAAVLGDGAWEKKCETRRRSLLKAFNRELWSEEKQMYRDGKPDQCKSPLGTWLPADKNIETFSSQVNILATAYGLAPQEKGPQILEKVMQSGPANCQPYFMHFAFEALAKTGLFNRWATQQMRRWKIVPDTQTFPEMWDRGDLSHAWQCSPTYQMSTKILGISPLEPGFKQILIKPHPCDLDWAKGKVPTPHGPVSVDWKLQKGKFEIKISVPKGAKAKVVLPDSSVHEAGAGSHFFRCDLEP